MLNSKGVTVKDVLDAIIAHTRTPLFRHERERIIPKERRKRLEQWWRYWRANGYLAEDQNILKGETLGGYVVFDGLTAMDHPGLFRMELKRDFPGPPVLDD